MTGDVRPGRARTVGLVVGGAIMTFGVRGLIQDAAATHPGSLLTWVVGADLLHDFVVAPLTLGVAWVIGRALPDPWRTPVRAGLFLSALVGGLAWPGLRGYGRDAQPDNPTVQPLDYRVSALVCLGVVWTLVAVWGAIRVRGEGS